MVGHVRLWFTIIIIAISSVDLFSSYLVYEM